VGATDSASEQRTVSVGRRQEAQKRSYKHDDRTDDEGQSVQAQQQSLPGRAFAVRIIFMLEIRPYPSGYEAAHHKYRTHDVLNGNLHDTLVLLRSFFAYATRKSTLFFCPPKLYFFKLSCLSRRR
jgi:hypothetical protein